MGFDAFVERYHEHMTRDPNACVNLGVERNLDALPDPSLEGVATRLTHARVLLDEVEGLGREVTSFDHRLDCELAALSLRAEIHTDTYTFHGQSRLEHIPTAADDIGDGLFMLFIDDPRPAAKRLGNILSRLRAVPEYLEVLLGRLGTPLERWRAMDLEKVGELPSLFATLEDVEVEIRKRFAPPPGGRPPERILARYQSERARVLAFISEHDLFPIPADQEMKILRTPGFMTPSIPAGAMVSPAPFRAGIRTSLIYLTLSDELVAHHCELDVPGMMIHEGIPGHHLQLAAAAAHPSVVRRHVSAMDQAEGWTTMLEDYMLDVGYMGELTDEACFVAKRDTNRIGARVAIDLFFMTGNRNYLDLGIDCDAAAADPFVAAGSLLRRVTGFAPGRVEAELNWYSQERGYPLSYLTGNRLVWDLKREVAAAQAETLSGLALDRKFHEVFLRAGNMPVSFLRKVFAEQGLL